MVLCWAGLASAAGGIDDWGTVSLGGGVRWVPQPWLFEKAEAAGTPVAPRFPLGPIGYANFSYGFSPLWALAIDVLGGVDQYELQRPDGGLDTYSSVTLAGLLGLALWGTDFGLPGVMPHVAAQLGPALSNVSSRATKVPERLLLSAAVTAGVTYQFLKRFGVTLEARYLYAWSEIPSLSALNVGGLTVSAAFTFFFPPSSKHHLQSSGF